MLTKILRYGRRHGMRALVRRVAQAVWHDREYLLYAKTVQASAVPGEHEDVHFRIGTPADLAWLVRRWPGEFSYIGPVKAALEARLAKGETLLIGERPGDEQDPVYLGWLARHDFALQAYFGGRVPEGHLCAKNIYVFPAHRRRGVARRAQEFAEGVAAKRGVHTLWAFVLPENDPSRGLHESLGYAMRARVVFRQRLGRPSAVVLEGGAHRRVGLAGMTGHVA